MLDRGLGNAQIAMLLGVYAASSAVFELPTGVLADRWSRKWSQVLGATAFFVAVVLEAHCKSFAAFAAVHVLFGLGSALASGADVAFHYDLLAKARLEHRFAYSQALLNNCERVGIVLAFVSAGPLASALGVQTLLYLSLVPIAVRIALLAGVEEPRKTELDDQESTAVQFFDVATSHLVSLVIASAAISVGYGLSDEFASVLLDEVGFPTLIFGTAGAVLAAAGIFEPLVVRRLSERGSIQGVAQLGTVAILFCLVLLFVSPWLAAGVLLIAVLAMEFSSPLMQAAINDVAPAKHRATVHSSAGLLGSLLFVPGGIAFGVAADRLSVQTALAVASGAWILAGLVALCVAKARVRRTSPNSRNVAD